ncbi:MAG: hypothetical protein ABI472_02325 [Ginsengibacter sp.]
MTKYLAGLISFFIINLSAGAQVQRETNPTQNTATVTQKKNKKEISKELNLTREQRRQLKDFRQSAKQKKEEIDNDTSLTDTQKQDKLRHLRMEQKEKLNTILTPEQKEKLKEKIKDRETKEEVAN